jgi:hypothetical protein
MNMKTLTWILGLALLAAIGYLVYDFFTHRRTQAAPTPVPTGVGPESIAAYEQRIEELQAKTEALKARMKAAGTLERPDVQERLHGLQARMDNLAQAVRHWKMLQDSGNKDEAYRQCILLYGKASGVCDALAPDTLRGK